MKKKSGVPESWNSMPCTHNLNRKHAVLPFFFCLCLQQPCVPWAGAGVALSSRQASYSQKRLCAAQSRPASWACQPAGLVSPARNQIPFRARKSPTPLYTIRCLSTMCMDCTNVSQSRMTLWLVSIVSALGARWVLSTLWTLMHCG